MSPGLRTRELSPQKTQQQKPIDACAVAATEKGKIVTGQLSATAVAILGLTGSVGYFRNQETGTHGYFITVGAGAGADVGVGLIGSKYNNAASFVGYNDNVNVSLTAGIGMSWSRHNDLNENRVGNSFGPSAGAEAGISGTMTSTSLFWCTLGNKK